MTKHELELKKKNELQQSREKTRPDKVFVPEVDIYENQDALILEANMPGVSKESIKVDLKDYTLKIRGEINKSDYEDLNPVYGEYNVGHYERAFDLSNTIDQEKIEASLDNGVLVLTLPKVEKAKPRSIEIQ